jgi:gliding motility-associated-like protein/uncharacterized repeat protein (TIGR01451 family)
MKITTFLTKMVSLRSLIALLLFASYTVNAQYVPIYGTTIISQSHTDFSNNAVDQNLTTRARVRASSGIALGAGAYSGHLEVQFPTVLPANTTTYVKIQTDDNILPALLGGSLGSLVADVLGVVLIGNQEFTIQAKNNNTVIMQGNSQITSDFGTPQLKIVVNKSNDYFIAITPSQAYNRIRLTNRVGSLLGLGNTKRLEVFDMFYVDSPSLCGEATYTSYNGSGINLDLLRLGQAGVTNPKNVLDANTTNFSRLSLGVVAVAASVEQTVHFDGASAATDQFFIRLKVDPSLLALGVANNIQIIATKGTSVVQTVNLNSLLNLDLLTLLQGNQVARIPFAPNAPVDNITVRYNSLLNVQLTQSLDLYDIIRTPSKPIITDVFTADPTVCSGSVASLVAQTIGANTQLKWYTQLVGGNAVATTNSGQPFVTPVLQQNTTYYVATVKTGCNEESERIKVTLKVIPLPVTSNIIIPETLGACGGSVVLAPSSSIGGVTFKYYKDPLKTQQITTGYNGDAGVNYSINPTSGVLSISGLSAVNSPYEYYISIVVDNFCENVNNTLKKVTVYFSSQLDLTVTPTLEDCGSVNLRNAILNFNNSEDVEYLFYNSSNQPITSEMAGNITANGIYFIKANTTAGDCSSSTQPVNVIVHPNPVLTLPNTNYAVGINTSFTLEATTNGTIVWYNTQGNALASNVVGPFTTPGFYSYTAVASLNGCSVSQTVYLTVVDTVACPPITNRVYATSQSWGSIITGGVSNGNAAVDGNPYTHSTVTTGLGLLGVGTTWQNIQWDHTISAGTPVTVKLGSEYSGLTLVGAYSIVGTKRNALGTPIDIGVIQPLSASLVDLLPGQNVFEYTFIPSNITGPKDYDGIRISVGALVSVAQNIKIYEAHYKTLANNAVCNQSDVEDVYYGAVDLGIGALTATVGVDNAYNAVDNSTDTYATMFSGVGVLAAAEMTVVFKTPSLPSDKIEIIISRPSTLLELSLLSGFSIQAYLGNTPAGAPIDNASNLLHLTLLNGGQQARLIIDSQNQSFDRIKIRVGGVATVLDFLFVHDIKRIANTVVIGADETNTIQACQNDEIQLTVPAELCASYIWYDAPQGGTIISTGNSYVVPASLAAGTYDFYIQPTRFGCEAFTRGKVTVLIGANAPESAITQVTINGETDTILCNDVTSVILEAVLATGTISNPIYYWYSENNDEITAIAGNNTSTLAINDIVPGTYVYFVGMSSDEYCATVPAERFRVAFTVQPFSQASHIAVDNVVICDSQAVVIVPTSTLTAPEFFWYVSNDTSQPITDGLTVGAVNYTISSNGTLTITGLQQADSPFIYYVAVASATTCSNQSGNLKAVTITIMDSGTPTTNSVDQNFCAADQPTLADIQVNEANVIWYANATGGTPLLATEPLVSGNNYFAAYNASTGCESAIRLEINVTVSQVATPTTVNTEQEFCVASQPTIADIQVNEPNVIWFSALTDGNVLATTDNLVDGATYYAALVDNTTLCTSTVRLAITTTLIDTPTPSISTTKQVFCVEQNPTIADIQVNETNVIWYDALTGGNVVVATDNLVDGTIYYGALVDNATNCESSVRLAVTVMLNDAARPTTTNTTQSFCLGQNPTIADIQVNETNVIWYDALTGGNVVIATEILVDGVTYYTALVDDATNCESSVHLAVTVILNDAATPTTTNTTQSFCLVQNPTVASIQVNETNVIWYDALTDGNVLATTEILVDGVTYYAALVDNTTNCESSVRLAVTVMVSDAATPTTTDITQSFCLVQNPTVASIQVNEANVAWFNTATGGTALPATTPLVNEAIYYATLQVSGDCQSSERLAITVTVNDVTTPTTTATTQTFCATGTPTIANIQVNETNVIWYATAIGDTPLATTQALANGSIYYAAQIDPVSNCKSATRLAVTVVFSSEEAAVIEGNRVNVCAYETETYTTTALMNNYQWTVTNGTIVSGGQPTDNTITILWTSVGNGTVSVAYVDGCNTNNTANAAISVVSCSDITIAKTVDNPNPSVGENVNFLITVNNLGMGQFQNIEVSENIPNGYTLQSVVASIGNYNTATGIWTIPTLQANQSATLTVTVKVLSTGNYLNTASIIISEPIDADGTNNSAQAEVTPTCLTVYNEFSPNGDGANDTFKIDCIENYPNTKLQVYNRYGKLVYSKNNYTNDWDGTANVSGVINKDESLPAGTYYYVLEVGNDGGVKTGWLALTR